MQPSLPTCAIDEAFDFANLAYLGPDPEDSGNAYLVGPHGVPMRLEYAPSFSAWKQSFAAWTQAGTGQQPRFQVFLTMPTPRVKVTDQGDIRFRMTYKAMAVRLMIDDPDGLPDDNRERALAIIQLFSQLTAPTPRDITNGTMEEMLQIFQDLCDLSDKPVALYSSHPEGFRANVVFDEKPLSKKDDFFGEIAAWFNPTGGRVDLAQFRANERTRILIRKFYPETLSAHDRIAAGGRAQDWILAHADVLHWDKDKLAAVFKRLGLG